MQAVFVPLWGAAIYNRNTCVRACARVPIILSKRGGGGLRFSAAEAGEKTDYI